MRPISCTFEPKPYTANLDRIACRSLGSGSLKTTRRATATRYAIFPAGRASIFDPKAKNSTGRPSNLHAPSAQSSKAKALNLDAVGSVAWVGQASAILEIFLSPCRILLHKASPTSYRDHGATRMCQAYPFSSFNERLSFF